MARTYIRRVAHVPQLYVAWSHISDSTKSLHRHSAGIDGESVNQFAAKADHYLHQISGALLSSAGYDFSPLKARLEPKQSGSDRVICVPTVRDRIVQRSILDVLSQVPRISFESDVSYGFIKGKGVRSAIRRAIDTRMSFPWAYKTDISKFFDSLERKRVHSEIRRLIRAPTLHELLIHATCCEIRPRDTRQSKRIRRAGIRRGKGIRQGMPISPYLANLFLWDFDREVIRSGIPMVRYADDLVLFGRSSEECEEFHEFCMEELAKIDLGIDPVGCGKTSIHGPEDSVEFLGIAIDSIESQYVANVPQKKIDNCRSEIMSLGNLDSLIEQRISISGLMKKLDGKIAGWTEAYRFCKNLERFRHVLASARARAVERVFKDGLGMTTLTRAQREFLEIE